MDDKLYIEIDKKRKKKSFGDFNQDKILFIINFHSIH